MNWQLSISQCAGIRGYDTDYIQPDLLLKDTDKLPLEGFFVIGLVLDNTAWGIAQYFADKDSLVSYLNSTFSDFSGTTGTFQEDGDFITYSNPEHFKRAEIMSIYRPTLLIYKFGEGSGTPLQGYTAEYDDQDDMITDSDNLLNRDILQIRVNGDDLPLTEENVIQNPINKTLSFTESHPNSNIYILVSPISPSLEEGFPYVLPINF